MSSNTSGPRRNKDSRAPLGRKLTVPVKSLPHLNPTQHDLPEGVRRKITTILNDQLADIIDLQSQTKQAHWNVKGPNFIGLHELFDKIAGKLTKYVDAIAERGVELGGVALGTVRLAASRSRLPEYPLEIQIGSDHVKALSANLARYGATLRADIERAENLGDTDTADLFTQISRSIDKYLWMVEAHQLGR